MSTFTSAAVSAARDEARSRVAVLWADTEIPVSLDGRRAVVGGFANPFATIATIGRPSYTVEYSWVTVERIMLRADNPGAFQS